MRLNWRAIFPALLVLFVTSCFEKAPEYSPIPSIEFSGICFTEGISSSTTNTQDTLSLTLKFRDGDGNLGLSASTQQDNEYPYNEKYYFQKNADGTITKVTKNTGVSMLSYKDKRTNPKYAALPEFVTPYNCTNWEVIYTSDKNPKPTDSVYFEFNPDHYNIFVDFLIKNNDGSFTPYDFEKAFIYPNCPIGGFNGRYPVLSNDLDKKSPLEGTLNYKLKSLGLRLIFSIKTLKLRIKITDRTLNKSNELETPEFTLQSINCN
jgi:hypothetical protein